MKKRILLIGYNFYPEPTGIGKYSGEMIRWLAEKGYQCSVLTAYPYYPYWQVQEPYYKNRLRYKTESEMFDSGGQIKIYRCPMYVPSNPSGLKRIALDFSFLLSAFVRLLPLLTKDKFDFVVAIAPSFQFGLLGVFYKKLSNAKLVYHIQDMQIEAARDLGMIKSKKAVDYLFKAEKYIFNQSNVISTISEEMRARTITKAEKEVLLFKNWADIDKFMPVQNKDSLKSAFGFERTDKIILYSGAIGEKQGLEAILQAADYFRNQKELKFVVCGSGPYKNKLQADAVAMKLDNVIFLPLQPAEKFNAFLNVADIHLVIQKANASDLVMPSKLTTILSVGGVALITASAGSSLYRLVNQYAIGLLVDAEDQQALNQGIAQAMAADNEYIARNARTYAVEHLSIEQTMRSFEAAVLLQ